MKREYSGIIYSAALLILGFMLSACGGSSGSATPSTTVSGVVMAGPASGAKVKIKSVLGNYSTTSTTTGINGDFQVTLPNSVLSGDLIFEAKGGTFHDEATYNSAAPVAVAFDMLTAHVNANSLSTFPFVAIDPSSTIIQKLVAGGKTKTTAEADFAKAFGYIPDSSIKPVFAGMSSASTTPERLAGLRAAAFSQLTKDLTLNPDKQFELINAIVTDLADNGTLDGGSVVATKPLPLDLCNKFGQALVDFQKSTNNKSKLTMDKIGTPVFNKVALTESYKVEFVPGTMAAATGKTMFKIKLTNRIDNSVAGGKTDITLKPFMYMSSKSHTTPTMTVTESSTVGTYDCTIYYVMSTAMSGMSMGIWEVKVVIGTESATFYPDVAMSMGTTPLTKILGVDDKITGMAGLENRTYFLFNDGIVKEGVASTYTVNLFTATKEMMTNFPAVYNGKILKNESSADWTVSGMSVKVSSDKTNWTSLTDISSNGHWTVSGITPDMNSKIYVMLTIFGEQKTTDGKALAADGSNGYQTFTVTPGGGMAM